MFTNFKKFSGLFVLSFTFVFLFSAHTTFGEEPCELKDSDGACIQRDTPVTQHPSNNGSVQYGGNEAVVVSVRVPYDDGYAIAGETFDVSWNVEWRTAELPEGRILYVVKLFEDSVLLRTWSADSERGDQAPDSGSYTIQGGITSEKTYSVTAEVRSYYSGEGGSDTDSVSLSIKQDVERCKINSFTVDNKTPASGTSTKLRFSLDGTFPWTLKVVGGPNSGASVASGNSRGSLAAGIDTGPISGTKTFRLSCNNQTERDVSVTVSGTPPPPGGGGGGSAGWCGPDDGKNSNGPRINVPSAYTLMGGDRIHKYSTDPEHYEVPGAVLNFSGTTTPPPGTDYIVATINMDDGGSVAINGIQVYSVAPTCSIKNNQIVVTNMNAGEPSYVSLRVVNSGLGGVGAYIDFQYYRTPGGSSSLTPIVTAPSCSNTDYSVQISWDPIDKPINIFLDDNGPTSSWWKPNVDGESGSTSAPSGFVQRIGAPQTLTFSPGSTHSVFIDVDGSSGDTVSWTVNTCSNNPDLSTDVVTPTTALAGASTNFQTYVTNNGAPLSSSFDLIFQTSTLPEGAGTLVTLPKVSVPSFSTLRTEVSKQHTFNTPGIYYMRACADKDSATDTGSITESNENNNCGEWTAVSVVDAPVCPNGTQPPCVPSNLPDFTADNVTPNTGFIGIPVMLNSIIRNIGN